MVQDNSTDQKGHRQRLRQRFVEAGPVALADYEMLELLLFHAIPRRDTKPVAKRLINHFGSYAAVLRADVKALGTVKGVGETTAIMLKSVADAAERLARDEVMDRVVLSSWDALMDYLKISMARQETERFRILFLDVKNALIADEEQQSGTVNHAPVYPREVIKRALELGASALMISTTENHLLKRQGLSRVEESKAIALSPPITKPLFETSCPTIKPPYSMKAIGWYPEN